MPDNNSLNVHSSNTRIFFHLLANTLFVSVINFTIWFAITFYTYIQTGSVFATGIIAGIFLVLTTMSGIWFGSLVDHNKKKMQLSSLVSLLLYICALVIYWSVDRAVFTDPTNPILWLFIILLMVAVIVGNIRTIAMPTHYYNTHSRRSSR